jgi:hypothetical protein
MGADYKGLGRKTNNHSHHLRNLFRSLLDCIAGLHKTHHRVYDNLLGLWGYTLGEFVQQMHKLWL